MKQPQNRVIYNLDGEAVLDLNTGEYLMNFSERQMESMDHLLRRSLSIRGLAYVGLPDEHMEFIEVCLIDDALHHNLPIPSDLDIWKVVHTDLDIKQFCYVFGALPYGLNMVDKIENICMYSNSFLRIVSNGIRIHDIDLTGYIHPDLTLDELNQICKKEQEKAHA